MSSSQSTPLAQGMVYLCRASGEGSHDFRVCKDDAAVFAFYESMFGRDYDGTLDSITKDFHDADEWSNDGTAREIELYCAKFEIWKADARQLTESESTESTSMTPRTDANLRGWNIPVPFAEFARQLERELAAMSELYAKEGHKNMVLMETQSAAASPSEATVRIARESIDTAPGNFEQSRDMLREMGLPLVAAIMDEHMVLCREIIRLHEASGSRSATAFTSADVEKTARGVIGDHAMHLVAAMKRPDEDGGGYNGANLVALLQIFYQALNERQYVQELSPADSGFNRG